MTEYPFIDLPPYPQYSDDERCRLSDEFYQRMRRRRTVRDFSPQPVPRSVIEKCLLAAGTAPSGANQQPWHFCVVQDAATKKQIRIEAEKEEKEFYEHRAPQAWLDALRPLGTDEHKPFLEIAPSLVVVFAETYKPLENGSVMKHYYATESVGIATGILITALHLCGVATLTHTPSPMRFLNRILDRPDYERPFLLLVAGYPAPGCQVPDITKKSLDQIANCV